MIKLNNFFKRKEKPMDIIYDPCCNNCINGRREYLGLSDIVLKGVKCSLNIENQNKLDYLCDNYERDEKFIAYNKSL